jgi:hypothetical protein
MKLSGVGFTQRDPLLTDELRPEMLDRLGVRKLVLNVRLGVGCRDSESRSRQSVSVLSSDETPRSRSDTLSVLPLVFKGSVRFSAVGRAFINE